MSLRLTGLSNFLLFQRSLNIQNQQLFKTSEQLSTQKKINRPSDDPEGSRIVLGLKEGVERVQQYLKNLDAGERFLRETEVSLTSVKDLLVRAKELAIQGRNGILSTDSRNAIAAEVQQLLQQLTQIGNAEVNGEYLFSGYRTQTAPFSLDVAQPNADPVETYAGDSNVRLIQVGDSVTLQVQSRGDTVFQGDGTVNTVNLFQTLADLEVALRAGNVDDTDASSVGQMIDDLDLGISQVLSEITSVGARTNRLETTRDHFEAQKETLKSFLASIEDVDIAEVGFEYQRASTALQATITAAGNSMQLPSLLDFIR